MIKTLTKAGIKGNFLNLIKSMLRWSGAGKVCGVNWEGEAKMQKCLESEVSLTAECFKEEEMVYIFHIAEVEKDEDRATSTEVTGSLEESSTTAQLTPPFTSHTVHVTYLHSRTKQTSQQINKF